MTSRYRKHLNVLLPIFVVIIIMLGLVSYSPELYRVFCGATGYGGTTQRAYTDPATRSARTVNVAFDSNVAPDLPWRFEPEQRSVTVHLGEQRMVFFTAENLSNESIVAHGIRESDQQPPVVRVAGVVHAAASVRGSGAGRSGALLRAPRPCDPKRLAASGRQGGQAFQGTWIRRASLKGRNVGAAYQCCARRRGMK